MQHRLLAVIVLYGIPVNESVSYTSLQRAAAGQENVTLHVILHDNSSQENCPEMLPPGVEYVHDPANSGLARAYNQALTKCLKLGYDWLLTLDQDTELPPAFLEKLMGLLDEVEGRTDIGAVVPEIHAGGRIVSPNWFAAGAVARWFPEDYRGVPQKHVFAFNSGSLVRVSALRQIGGYSPWFWLDNSDAWLFQQLHSYGKRVFIDGELKLQHDFSMMNMGARVSASRYETILLAESAFWDMMRNRLAGAERTARLALRTVKHIRRNDPSELRHLTRKTLLRRLFRGRRYRLNDWRSKTESRLSPELLRPWRTPNPEPVVSVCMAAYGGEKYVEAQIRSILPQLRPWDELILVEDASLDGTAAVLKRLQEELQHGIGTPTLRLIRHAQNLGVVETFEDAVRSATGDILFLCDDDDIWAADKVEKVLAAFRADTTVGLVSTGLRVIDSEGNDVGDNGLLRHRNFNTSVLKNLWHNQFQGSTMAFRSSLVQHILPFPKDKLFLHDAWIGLRAILAGVRIVHLDEALLIYRRHSHNYSNRLSRLQQIRLRLELLSALLKQRFLPRC